ncbi:MAG TPA: phenylalanine--tRNA ligase subunit alpha [Dehalococcoidia bacterium]|nr:phenylalanine--tRNA ligase subunit alpha [Dehalococcoidia bacterium]
MKDKLDELRSKAISELDSIDAPSDLDSWRVRYLGRKSALTQVLRGLATLPLEEKRSVGAAANELRAFLEKSLALKEESVRESEVARSIERGRLDVTLPGRPPALGRLHPATQMLRHICDIFLSMGFEVVEGPDVEWEYYNFDALNIPPDHPARDMWDTLWIDFETEDGQRPMLLRTHTSPMQIRVMESRLPPVRVIVPGKVYRYEATDATHEAIFYQIEGFAVDRNITLADLKGTLFEFAKQLFGEERKVRFRCDYFPFVEPGVEMAIDCFACNGAGCSLCSGSGWIEILGAGMVHPDVLRRVNYDPEVYTGFAFGLGVERMSMLKYGIEDIRLFYSNDLRFLRQF